MKVLPESSEYFMLALQCDKLLQSQDGKAIETWGKDVAKAVAKRHIEIEKEISNQDELARRKKPRPIKDEFLKDLIFSMGGVYKGNYHYEIPDGLPTPLHLEEVGRLLMKRAFEIQTYPRFLWGTGLVLSAMFSIFAVVIACIAPADIFSWIFVALFAIPTAFCIIKLREIAPFREALEIMRHRISKSK